MFFGLFQTTFDYVRWKRKKGKRREEERKKKKKGGELQNKAILDAT